MSKLIGRWTALHFNGYDLSGRSRQISLEYGADDVDVTAFLDGSYNSLPGLVKTSGTFESFLDPDTDASWEALNSPGGYADRILSILIGNNATPTIGDVGLALACNQFQTNIPQEITGPVILTASFASVGKLMTFGKVLANTTITDTTTFSAYNAGATQTDGVAYLQTLTPTSTDTYSVAIEHSPDDVTYTTLATFTLDGTSRGAERLAISGTIQAYRRVVATRTGVAGDNFKLSVILG